MAESETAPSSLALEEARRLAGPSAAICTVLQLEGGQHADTWRVDTETPVQSVVLRQFPVADLGAEREQCVLRTLGGLGGLAPVLLGCDLNGRWSERPTTLISWLDGQADITPTDPKSWAQELGRALAVLHAAPIERLMSFPRVLDRSSGCRDRLEGPLAAGVRSRWAQVTDSAEVLTHSDYWSGNVVWRDRRLTGIVDWSGAARGPSGFDLGWCRLDVFLLFDEHLADVLLEAYEAAAGRAVGDVDLWDSWATARSYDGVETWAPNYAPLGRPDLDAREAQKSPLPVDGMSFGKNVRMPTLIFAHGACVRDGGWWWSEMTAPLAERGISSVAVALPSCGESGGRLGDLYDDADACRRAIAEADAPVILCGHSYGGMVITEAGADERVTQLLYVTSVMADAGESQGDLIGSEPAPWLLPGDDGTIGVDPDSCASSSSKTATRPPPSKRLPVSRASRSLPSHRHPARSPGSRSRRRTLCARRIWPLPLRCSVDASEQRLAPSTSRPDTIRFSRVPTRSRRASSPRSRRRGGLKPEP